MATPRTCRMILIVLMSLLGGCFGGPMEYSLSSYCGGSITIDTSAILKFDGYVAGDCRVDVIANHAMQDNQVRAQVTSLDTVCGDHWLELKEESTGVSLSGQLCGTNVWNSRYLTVDDTLTVIVGSEDGSYSQASTRILVTSFSTWYTSGDYVCDNLDCVDSSLKCDGYNNCGDDSDEDSVLCDDDIISWSAEIGIIGGLGAALLITSLIVVVLVVRGRRRRAMQGDYVARRQALMKPSGGPAPPPYGAINAGYTGSYSGSYNGGFNGYNGGYATMPPPPYNPYTMPPPAGQPAGPQMAGAAAPGATSAASSSSSQATAAATPSVATPASSSTTNTTTTTTSVAVNEPVANSNNQASPTPGDQGSA